MSPGPTGAPNTPIPWPWLEIGLRELLAMAGDPSDCESLSVLTGHPACLVWGDDHGILDPADAHTASALAALASLPCVFVGAADQSESAVLRALVDVLPGDPQSVVASIAEQPIASAALALLLRAAPHRSIGEGLIAESSTYSLLQSGPEFAAWRVGWAARPPRRPSTEPGPDGQPGPDPPPIRPAVLIERDFNTLHITLNRPEKHNAFSVALRDALAEALTVAAIEPDLQVVLDGAGPSFCSGGDLDEFGHFPDPATAHLIRLTRSPTRLISQLADRVTVHLHGACLGAGIEIAAFAGRVIAHPDARIGLPELGLGLIPGAGGTVSLPRRIGRHRTALLALTKTPITADTAERWGLIDAVAVVGPGAPASGNVEGSRRVGDAVDVESHESRSD